MSLPPCLLTDQDVDEFWVLYSHELDLPPYEKAVIRQGLAMMHEAVTNAVPYEKAPWVPEDVCRAVYQRAGWRCEYCMERVARRSSIRRLSDPELEHMVAKWPLIQFRASWDLIHDPANVLLSCGRCNGEKLTVSLPPGDLARMWETLGIDGTTTNARLLAFYSTLLETRPFNIRRFEGVRHKDLRSIMTRINAYYRLRENEKRRALAEQALLAGPSDDARELWVGPNGRRVVNLAEDYGPRRDASGRPLPLRLDD